MLLGGGREVGCRVRISLELRYRHRLTCMFSEPASADGAGSTPSTRHRSVAPDAGLRVHNGVALFQIAPLGFSPRLSVL